MIRAHRVGLYDKDGFRWSLLDDATGDFLHGGENQQLADVVGCWLRQHAGAGARAVDIEPDGRPIRPLDFAELVIQARRRLNLTWFVPRDTKTTADLSVGRVRGKKKTPKPEGGR